MSFFFHIFCFMSYYTTILLHYYILILFLWNLWLCQLLPLFRLNYFSRDMFYLFGYHSHFHLSVYWCAVFIDPETRQNSSSINIGIGSITNGAMFSQPNIRDKSPCFWMGTICFDVSFTVVCVSSTSLTSLVSIEHDLAVDSFLLVSIPLGIGSIWTDSMFSQLSSRDKLSSTTWSSILLDKSVSPVRSILIDSDGLLQSSVWDNKPLYVNPHNLELVFFLLRFCRFTVFFFFVFIFSNVAEFKTELDFSLSPEDCKCTCCICIGLGDILSPTLVTLGCCLTKLAAAVALSSILFAVTLCCWSTDFTAILAILTASTNICTSKVSAKFCNSSSSVAPQHILPLYKKSRKFATVNGDVSPRGKRKLALSWDGKEECNTGLLATSIREWAGNEKPPFRVINVSQRSPLCRCWFNLPSRWEDQLVGKRTLTSLPTSILIWK